MKTGGNEESCGQNITNVQKLGKKTAVELFTATKNRLERFSFPMINRKTLSTMIRLVSLWMEEMGNKEGSQRAFSMSKVYCNLERTKASLAKQL